MMAAKGGHTGTCVLLLENGASLDEKNKVSIIEIKVVYIFISTIKLFCLEMSLLRFKGNFVLFHGSSFKGFSIVFLLPNWLKSNHLKSRMDCRFSDIFSRHICSTLAETIAATNYAASFGAKKCSENYIWSCWDDAWSVELTKLESRFVAIMVMNRYWYTYWLIYMISLSLMISKASARISENVLRTRRGMPYRIGHAMLLFRWLESTLCPNVTGMTPTVYIHLHRISRPQMFAQKFQLDTH